MKKLSKQKQQQLLLVVLITAGVLAGLWLGLINAQQRSLIELAHQRADAESKLQSVETAIKNAGKIQTDLASATDQLAKVEHDMPSGDLYSWIYNTIRQFKLPYKVDVPQFSTVVTSEESLLPKFPYRQATVTVSGTGYYHDIGTFIADLENRFPYMRLVNLNLQSAQGTTPDQKEKLLFKMDIVTLIKAG